MGLLSTGSRVETKTSKRTTKSLGTPVTFIQGADSVNIDANNRPGAASVNNASSSDFINALETSDSVIYTGHHFKESGTVLLSDGEVTPTWLLKQADSLPKNVYLNGCNTSKSLPRTGEFPNTTFIGNDGFIEKWDAVRQTNQAYTDLVSSDPIGNLLKNKLPGTPGMTAVVRLSPLR